MKRNALMTVIISLAVNAFGDERLDKLSAERLKWLEQEVVYIITEKQRDVFLSLDTLEERDASKLTLSLGFKPVGYPWRQIGVPDEVNESARFSHLEAGAIQLLGWLRFEDSKY